MKTQTRRRIFEWQSIFRHYPLLHEILASPRRRGGQGLGRLGAGFGVELWGGAM
jgi:hypothetical protein